MSVKTLTIKEGVYNSLLRIKSEDESFSDLFERLVENEQPDLMKYAGILSESSARKIRNSALAFRKEFNKSFSERLRQTSEKLRRK